MKLQHRIRRGTQNKAMILLHGFGASMDDLFPLADYIDPEKKFDMIFPNAPVSVPIGPHMEGRAWFPLNMEEIERAMMSGTYRSYVDNKPAAFDQGVERIREYIVGVCEPYESVILGGFSQGGMIASHLAFNETVKVDKLVLMSTTLVDKTALEKAIQSHSLKFPVFLSHGKADPVLSPAIAEEFVCFLENLNFEVDSIFFQGGHEIPYEVIQKIQAFCK